MINKKFKHIELFAGCGGMSLGMDAAGFELFFANELSPMAAETFSFNILDEEISDDKEVENTLWIKSQFTKDEIQKRLRENPFEATNGKYSDLDSKTNFSKKLLVGDLNDLLTFLKKYPNVRNSIKNEGIDLISGGPPCQSFSLAGRREKNNYKNSLPLSFAEIAGLIKPKMVLLENVKGITAPFTENDVKYHAWLEVAKAFALEGFVPVCMMLNAKYFGVAQNRPRFILLAYRKDVFDKLSRSKTEKTEILEKSNRFYLKTRKNKNDLNNVDISDLDYYDIEQNPQLFNGDLFPKITNTETNFVTAFDAINDIRNTTKRYKLSGIQNDYSQKLNRTFSKKNVGPWIKNHIPRSHRYDVQARFRFFQVISKFKNGQKQAATDLFRGKEIESEKLDLLFQAFTKEKLFYKENEKTISKRPQTVREVQELVELIPSKKHSQRAILECEPAPAQLTIPDDLCHYDENELRTMTVREMARFQSFPDWFEFKSKVTTGGLERRFEVPQYTQVGNAVPPLLALALGKILFKQLNNLSNG